MSSSRYKPKLSECYTLFPPEMITPGPRKRTYKRVDHPIWSHNKARFIALYLKFFVYITHHGVYIDGFAGPQYANHLDAWTAAQVLRSRPQWLRQFFLCDIKPKSIAALQKLVANEPLASDNAGKLLPRTISVHDGDFNITIDTLLKSDRLSQKEATFCLLDQRTFECHWDTLLKLAAYKQKPHNKIELLYFLGVGWIHRAISGLKDHSPLERWWGRSDWSSLKDLSCIEMAELVRDRFCNELGYKHTVAYPIFDSRHGNKVMYYMIHASDHEEAPALMVRAHSRAVRTVLKETQRELWPSTKELIPDRIP
jgi:three-Cys-motif partner protein